MTWKLVALVLGLAFLIAILILALLGVNAKGAIEVSEDGLKIKIEVSQPRKRKLTNHLEFATRLLQNGAGLYEALEQIRNLESIWLLRVLWIEDRPRLSLLGNQILSDLNFVITQTSWEAARQALNLDQFDLIIAAPNSDDQMQSGLGFLRELREGLRTLPIFVYGPQATSEPTRSRSAGELDSFRVIQSPAKLVSEVLAISKEYSPSRREAT